MFTKFPPPPVISAGFISDRAWVVWVDIFNRARRVAIYVDMR